MPYNTGGTWEQLIEGNRKVNFWLTVVSSFTGSTKNIGTQFISNVSLESSAASNNAITFGSTCSDCLKVTLRNIDPVFLFEGEGIMLNMSVEDDNEENYLTHRIGSFFVDSIKKTETLQKQINIEITAYDGFYKMEQKYVPSSSLTLPASIREVAKDIVKVCGIYDPDFGISAINSASWSDIIQIDSIKADLTCRQQIGYLASLQGCFAKFDNGFLYAKWYSQTEKTITSNEQFLAEMTRDTESDVTVKMIETGTTDNAIVKPSSAIGYSIKFENPYITDEIADDIYTDKVSDDKIKFRPLSVRWRGNPKIVVGDIVNVEDSKGNNLICYVMQKTLSFDGGLSETYKCYGESTQSVSFGKSPTDIKLERVYSRMEEAVKSATSAVKQTQGSTFELIPDSNDSSKNIGYRLYYKDSGDSAYDDCVIMATAGGIGFSTNGGDSFDAAAMYFGKDESGQIHGYINGEFIAANSISADKIDTSQLVITSGNVEGLDDTISQIEYDTLTANTNANTATSTATDALSTASSAKSTADSVNTVIGQWCYNNNTTYINGGKIYTGSITADKIAANSITTDKLKVGTVELEGKWDNNDFSSSSTDNATGWEGVYTSFERQTDCLRAIYNAKNKNKISDSVSDFKMSPIYGWETQNATLTPHYNAAANTHYATLTASSSGRMSLYTSAKYKIEKGKMYSIAAKFNGVYWQAYDDDETSQAGYIYGNNHKYQPTSQRIFPDGENKERIIEWTFTYNGETTETSVGIYFYAQANSSINLDWVVFYETPIDIPKGFRSSYSGWLAEGVKKTNLVTYQNTPESYITSRQGENGDVQRMTRRQTLKNGKRYALVARLYPNIHDLSGKITATINKTDLSFEQQAASPETTARNATTFKFVFDYTGESGLCDVGISWKGLQNTPQSKSHADVDVYWIQLYQDDVDELGFYCSSVGWLKSSYQTSNYIKDEPLYADYEVIRSALQVYNNALYFRGKVTSPYGNVGGLDYAPNSLSVSCDTAYYEETGSITASTSRESFTSSMIIEKSLQIISLDEIDSILPVDLQSHLSVTQKFNLQSDSGEQYSTDINAAGIKAVSGAGYSYSKLYYNGIETTGTVEANTVEANTVKADTVNAKTFNYTTFSPTSISTGNITSTGTVETTSSNFAGFVHNRTGYGTIKAGAGTAGGISSAVLELSESGSVTARIDVTNDGGYAAAKMYLTGKKGQSSPLALGMGDYSNSIWFNGNLITSNSAEALKHDINIYNNSAIDLINSSVVYSYKYNHDGDNAPTKYGLVIERECPKEVVDNSGDTICLYSMTSLAWKAIQEISQKIEALEEKIQNQ